jgi:hypothetical protein
METETPDSAKRQAKVQRALAIIIIVAAVLITLPIFLFMMTSRGASHGP